MEPWDTPTPKGPVENKKPKKVTEKRVREIEERGESCATEIKSKREHRGTAVLSLIGSWYFSSFSFFFKEGEKHQCVFAS